MIITEELLESFKTNRGGYTASTLYYLGVSPTKGWKKKVIGQWLSDVNYEEIIKSIDVRNNKNNNNILTDEELEAKKERKRLKAEKRKARRKAQRELVNYTPIKIIKPVQPKLNIDYKKLEYYKSKEFLDSYEWANLRMMALKKYGGTCMCCGQSRLDGITLNVDHIKPRLTHPELALDINNLQILCSMCNKGKGNWDETDWRLNSEK